MNPGRRIQLIAGLAAAGGLVGSSVLTTALSAEAGRAQLVYADKATEGDPPEVAVGIALGAFRGVFANILWVRAQKLKEEGRFYESMDLAQAITRLQPRFPRVWVFHAWNMAYNISVATDTAEERWMWVKAGIDLLRDEAIPKNPNDPLLHKELAWIFNHKIQAVFDDANQYYKRRLAEEWTIVLGPPPKDGDTYEARVQERVNWLRDFARAPDSIEEAAARVPAVTTLVERLKEEAGLDPDRELLRALEVYLTLSESPGARQVGLRVSDDIRNEGLVALMRDESLGPAWRILLPTIRKGLLVREYNMEPGRMIRYTEKFGPLDWRHPSSHALYWSLRGDEQARQRDNTEDFDITNTNRISLHAVQELRRTGDLYYNILSDSYTALPNLDYIRVYGDLLAELQEKAEEIGDVFLSRARVRTSFGSGYENFMADSVRLLYRAGRMEEAAYWYERLRTFEGLNISDPLAIEDRLSKPLAEFVEAELKDAVTSTPYVAVEESSAALRQAYLKGLLGRRDGVFRSNYEYARQVHAMFLEENLRRTMADAQTERMEVMPRRFETYAASILLRMLIGGELGLDDQAVLWRQAPLILQQFTYDALREAIVRDEQDEQQIAYMNRLFPEPANMAAFRASKDFADSLSDQARKAQMQTQQQ
ncbi:MAG: hypothetical protein ACTS27_08110 [Phycisphaerales bacterium]